MEAISDAEKRLGSEGRVLVRYSGTENKCRVMLEGKDMAEITFLADNVISEIKKALGE
jgi:phosphoglucosamine mutase